MKTLITIFVFNKSQQSWDGFTLCLFEDRWYDLVDCPCKETQSH